MEQTWIVFHAGKGEVPPARARRVNHSVLRQYTDLPLPDADSRAILRGVLEVEILSHEGGRERGRLGQTAD
jgi:hypothetical protein